MIRVTAIAFITQVLIRVSAIVFINQLMIRVSLSPFADNALPEGSPLGRTHFKDRLFFHNAGLKEGCLTKN